MPQTLDFNAVRISLASPDQIVSWSSGEVTKPETINYRTLRPEKDGLFCERIFGPTKDWECFCGKYKKIRYKGVICDRCGVEVSRAKVRRERMGHITLASPVAHVWFSKGVPSRLGLLLDLSPRNLERVLYFAKYIVTNVDESRKSQLIELLKETQTLSNSNNQPSSLQEAPKASGKANENVVVAPPPPEHNVPHTTDTIPQGQAATSGAIDTTRASIEELQELQTMQLLTESGYRDLRDKYGDLFSAAMGAEGILQVLKNVDLVSLKEILHEEVQTTSGQRRKKAIKRLKVVEALNKSGNKPEWLILTMLPILPPDLRPMVQLDGGRFATSDLNDLYRRVINRNNRLKRLLDLGAPEIIIRNEKRMLQEAVDALIDNGRNAKAVSGSRNQKLKSLADLLRGKQGRFRQNLLGKRVDYSGRSVIVVGPELSLDQCGLPKKMALELFKPFVMNRLILEGHVSNIKSAKRMVERVSPEVWDILEEVIKKRPVLLNRAPTLHRLGIQAFQPILVEGSAVKIHPLVCAAFNADFDGDQMAVHVPLSREAVQEARQLMMSTRNMLSPSSGEPVVAPTLDMVFGCYYLTEEQPGLKGEGRKFTSFQDSQMAYENGIIDLRARIQVRTNPTGTETKWIQTTVGRIIFNEVLPPSMNYRNQIMDKNTLKDLAAECYRTEGGDETALVLDKIKKIGFHYASKSGTTIGINDIEVPAQKPQLIEAASAKIETLEGQFMDGLITEEERYSTAVRIWTETSDEMTKVIEEQLPTYGGVYLMAISGAKGNIAQIKQMAGMRGLMSDPRGRIIDLPIKSSFREGLSVLEYFISTHGARKGLADTALRTADSGYLTRRLIDVSQEVIVLEKDCGTLMGITLSGGTDMSTGTLMAPFSDRILGRITSEPIANPETGEIIVEMNQQINESLVEKISGARINEVKVRSPLNCEAEDGICALCYGRNPATGEIGAHGEAVGVMAAQSIGEPGTQLTMRTFHTGGIAGIDITSGLPRVEELFEARSPRGQAYLSDIEGNVEITLDGNDRKVTIINTTEYSEDYAIPPGYSTSLTNGDDIAIGAVIAQPKESESDKPNPDNAHESILSAVGGKIHLQGDNLSITWAENEVREYIIPPAYHLLLEEGVNIKAGDPITSGPLNPQDILRILGPEAVQQYLIKEVQNVYRSQGVNINNKHIEIIIRRMLSKVRVDSTGDTDMLPGELVSHKSYERINKQIIADGGEPAMASPALLGVTRASLNTDSFLAAASFQETSRVLTDASVSGSIDRLRGLKENVIIGRLIPANLEAYPEGRKRLGIDKDEWNPNSNSTPKLTLETENISNAMDYNSDSYEPLD